MFYLNGMYKAMHILSINNELADLCGLEQGKASFFSERFQTENGRKPNVEEVQAEIAKLKKELQEAMNESY